MVIGTLVFGALVNRAGFFRRPGGDAAQLPAAVDVGRGSDRVRERGESARCGIRSPAC